MHTSVKRGLAAVVGAAAAVAVAAAPASADPSFTPTKADFVGVGSDTTQDVLNSLAAKYNAGPPVKTTRRLASYNATGSATIVPATTCASIPRPNGSSAGVAAVLADTTGCLDFARSSRGPRSTTSTNTLRFFRFGKDAVTWDRASVTNAPANLTTANLRGIYQCTIRNWTQVGGRSGTIVPLLPQDQSGTRAFFLAAIGVTTPGSCVVSSPTFEENDGRVLNNRADKINALIPYSVAKYIAQSRGASVDNRAGTVLGNINGTTPTTGSGSTLALNPSFSATFKRDVFNAVKTSRAAEFAPIFGVGGYFCSSAAQTEIRRFGFGPSDSSGACGTFVTGI